jgi:hypothetical protein
MSIEQRIHTELMDPGKAKLYTRGRPEKPT